MNKFVSQNTRLIPNPVEDGAHIRRRVHRPTDPCQNRLMPIEDLFLWRILRTYRTNRDTSSTIRRIQPVSPEDWEPLSSPRARDDRGPLCERVASFRD